MEGKLKATVKTWKLLEAVKIAENFAQKKEIRKRIFERDTYRNGRKEKCSSVKSFGLGKVREN